MKKRALLLICVLMTIICVTAVSEGKAYSNRMSTPRTSGKTEAGISSDKAVSGYILKEFGLGKGSAPAANTNVKGSNAALLEALSAEVKKVAAGEISSTVFKIPLSKLTDKLRYTAAELGVSSLGDGEFPSYEAMDAYLEAQDARMNLDVPLTVNALKASLPYEMYWFGNYYSWNQERYVCLDGDTIRFTDDSVFIVELCVSSNYSVSGAEYTTSYDTTYGKRIKTAAANAQKIVDANAGKTDRKKLEAYKKAICDAVSYNHTAAGGSLPYGDPWQAVYVFDNDAKTNVVCEGYSKAFKYLCDLSKFKSSVSVTLVTGLMYVGNRYGNHMWNLVEMDGVRYLADITNCDAGTVGAPDKLFMAGYSDSKKSNGYWGYVYDANGSKVTYLYDEESTALYSKDELTVTKAGGSQKLPSAWEDKYCKYKISSDLTATVTKPAKTTLTKVVIPATIKVNGKTVKVTAISSKAFKGMSKLKKAEIGKNVAKIGANAFQNCKKLETIVIKTKLLTEKNVGKNAFKTGCKKGKVKCPSAKIKDYEKILKKKGLNKGMKFTK